MPAAPAARTKVEYEFNTVAFMNDIRDRCPKGATLREIAARSGGATAISNLSRMDNGLAPDMTNFMKLCGAFDLYPGRYFKAVVWEVKEEHDPNE